MAEEPSPRAASDMPVLRSAMMHHFVVNLALGGDRNRVLDEINLGRPHHRIMILALHIDGITVGEVVSILRVSHQTLARPVRELVAREYIELLRDPADLRVKRIRVTEAGRCVVERSWELQAKRFRAAFSNAGDAAIAAYFELHRRMLDASDLEILGKLDPDMGQSGARGA